MALTKVNRGGLNTGISDSSDATFLTVDSSEQAVIKSEGGAVTTSVQQGLAKVWVHYNGTGTIAVRDSLNVSSLNDSGTGQHQYNYANNMNSTNYTHIAGAGTASSSTSTSVDVRSYGVTASTSQSGNLVFYSATSGTGVYDASHIAASNHGDLA